ncbi:lactonase family protein [Streptomyces corynorhini]|uniref:Lactonase family protein n=1 Tax=Streptomyces corynorhini TaxID=2282652 RepID=A0A370AZF0_9ACTN|nr:lactonase family protein [Streptomyces corynorhini]RDG34968.1 lactonase family protein [Streptomyces corynorhini]
MDGSGGRVFIGSFTSAGGRGIVAADLDPRTGALTERGATDAVPDPSYLALAPDGSVLYAVSERPDGAAAALDVRAGGRAAPRPMGAPVPVGGAAPTHLALAGDRLLTANYGSGSVSVLPVADDGSLRAPVAVFPHGTGGSPGDRPRAAHAHHVVADPGGRWALCTDLGTDSVRILALPAAGEPTPHGETALRPGTGPRHLAFHPRGEHVYVVGELEPTLTVCRWDATAGVLEPVAETPVLPGTVAGETFPSTVVVSRDGRFVWVAVRGHDSISVLALDATYEKPEPVTAVDCGGRWPRDLALDPTGSRLYAANERSGDVTWFDLDRETGVPARAGSLAAPAASCVIFG